MAKKPLTIDILFVADPKKDGVISLGDVYIGQPSTDPEIEANRKEVTVVQEDGTPVLILPPAQPLNTGAGGVLLYQGSPVTVLVDGEYSLKINDNLGQQAYYVPSQNAETSVSLGGGKIINGSFEAITGTLPDNWLVEPTGTGTIASDTSQSANGLASLKFTSIDALGAGSAKSDPFDVDSGVGADVNFMLRSTGALTRNTVQMEWLNSSGNVVSTVTVADFNAGDSPTAWTLYGVRTLDAPVSAVQGRIILLGMNAGGGAMTGDSWFDGVRVNDHSVDLGSAVTADSTNNLSNKTIVDGQYAGTQTGFVGDVAGHATTAGSVTNQGALATKDTVDTGDITDLAVSEGKIVDNAVSFSNKVKKDFSIWTFTMTTSNPNITLPAGIYTGIANEDHNATMDGSLLVETKVNGVWKIAFSRGVIDGVFTEVTDIIISDGINTRVRFTYSTGNATPQPQAHFQRMYG